MRKIDRQDFLKFVSMTRLIVFAVSFFVLTSIPEQGLGSVAPSFQFPLDNYKVGVNGFEGTAVKPWHLGEDAVAKSWDNVYAIANGTIKYAAYQSAKGGYGGVYIIEHTLSNGAKVCSLYGHLNFSTFTKRAGDTVNKGDYLGSIGDSTNNGGWPEHLHFGIRKGQFVEGSHYYYYDNATGRWKWIWAYLGYTKYANLTQTTNTNYDVTPQQMINEWEKPSEFVKNHKAEYESTTSMSFNAHMVVKFSDDPKCYLLSNGALWPIMDEDTYVRLGFTKNDGKTADFSLLTLLNATDRQHFSYYIRGENIVSQGITVKIVDRIGPYTTKARDTWRDPASVYFFDNGKFRPITSEKTYFDISGRLYGDWSDIVEVTQLLFDYYGEGTAISSSYDVAGYFGGEGGDTIASSELTDATGNNAGGDNGGVETSNTGGGKGGGCFIATAVYGSYNCSNVIVLRAFRDRYLLTNSVGREFVKIYYKYSPPIALYIAKSGLLKCIFICILTPMVFTIKYPYLVLLYLCMISYMWRTFLFKRHKI